MAFNILTTLSYLKYFKIKIKPTSKLSGTNAVHNAYIDEVKFKFFSIFFEKVLTKRNLYATIESQKGSAPNERVGFR